MPAARLSWTIPTLMVFMFASVQLAGAQVREVSLPKLDRMLEPRVEQLWEVGAADGAEWEVFADVRDLAFGPDGALHVLDAGSDRVVIFEPSGAHRSSFGREGGGPQEFRFPTEIEVAADGRIWVVDLLGQSLKVFGPDGTLANTMPFAAQQRDPGTLSASGSKTPVVADRPRSARDGRLGVFAIDGESGATSLRHLVEAPPAVRMEQSGSQFRRVTPPQLSPTVRLVSLPDGRFAVASGVGYEIDVVSRDSSVLRVVGDVAPRTPTERDRENVRQRYIERQLALGDGPRSVGGFQIDRPDEDQVRRTAAEMRFAEQVPVIQRIAASPDGTLWVQRDGGPGAHARAHRSTLRDR